MKTLGVDEAQAELEDDWRLWLNGVYPTYFTAPFSPHHEEIWEWVWALRLGVKPDHPLVVALARGGAKSTSAEVACAVAGCLGRRRYGLYVSGTQDQADDHVGNVASALEADRLALFYPDHSDRKVGKFGHSRGWRRNRVWTSGGFVVDAMGLDVAARGKKLEDARPDFIILDDVDDKEDSTATTEKKIRTITRKVLPAGSRDVAILGVQNIIHPDSVFARLTGVSATDADFLANRRVVGPVPAIEDMEVEQREGRFFITGGRATWPGQDLDVCQSQMDEWGYTAFKEEAQHEVDAPPGGVWDSYDFDAIRVPEDRVPELTHVTVWVDPAVSDKDESDSMGIQADGLGIDGRLYRLRSWERRTSPRDALRRAIRWAVDLGSPKVGIETDQGGDTWYSVFELALKDVNRDRREMDLPAVSLAMDSAKAGSIPTSKVGRNQIMLGWYEQNLVRHVEGMHLALERSLYRFPKTKPLDLADAAFWSARDLLENTHVGTEYDAADVLGEDVRVSISPV